MPSIPTLSASMKTQGLPASMQVAVTPSITSVTFPVGKSFPVLEPLRFINKKFILEFEELTLGPGKQAQF